METKVMIPLPAVDFNFDSASTSPYVSAPSSPQRFGNYFFSAPTSPTRAASFFHEFSLIAAPGTSATTGDSLSAIPFEWEEKPGIPNIKDTTSSVNDEDDFVFDFSGQLERLSLSADELFDGGKIKPLKPSPRLQSSESIAINSPKSHRSPKRLFKEASWPQQKKKNVDPPSAAIQQTGRENTEKRENDERGRERAYNSSSSRHKGTRSLSPFTISDMLFEQDNSQQSSKQPSSSTSSSTWYTKWKLKDLLFRSASEGRATSKDPLKKYGLSKKGQKEDVKNSSFRSTDSSSSVSSLRRKGSISAHELHYTVNRAVSEEMRRKTFLPYKQGLLGCLGFNSSVHELF